MFQMLEANLILVAIIGIPSLIMALWLGRSWERDHPEKLGFKWGYFVILNAFIGNLLFVGFVILFAIKNGNAGALLFGILALASITAVAYFSLHRYRWALVVSTILSFNFIWMLINISYFKNRWAELLPMRSVAAEITSVKKGKSIPRNVRVALFAAFAWIVCVPSYVFLFRPYGDYMQGDDRAHLLGVIILPVAIGFMLFFLFQKFVK